MTSIQLCRGIILVSIVILVAYTYIVNSSSIDIHKDIYDENHGSPPVNSDKEYLSVNDKKSDHGKEISFQLVNNDLHFDRNSIRNLIKNVKERDNDNDYSGINSGGKIKTIPKETRHEKLLEKILKDSLEDDHIHKQILPGEKLQRSKRKRLKRVKNNKHKTKKQKVKHTNILTDEKVKKKGNNVGADFKNQVKKVKGNAIYMKHPMKLHRRKPKKKAKIVIPIQPEQVLSEEEKQGLKEKMVKSFGENYESSREYQTIVDKCSEYPKHKGRILFYHQFPYIQNQSHLCEGSVDILIAVHSTPSHFARRQLIRDTYGSMRNVNRKRIVIAFFVGNSGYRHIQKQIIQESQQLRDVVVRDFKENYRNMTYKHVTVMDWIMEYCHAVKYLVKVDDDVFVNIFQVIEYIDSFNPTSFYCTRTTGPRPMRKRGKWKLTFQEYPKLIFPPYCMGYAYLMRASLAKKLYWCSIYSKFLWIDDIFIGGILPEKLGLQLIRFIHGHASGFILPSHASWKIVDYMFLVGARNEMIPNVIEKIWRAALRYNY